MSSLTHAGRLESRHLGGGGGKGKCNPYTQFSLNLISCVLSPCQVCPIISAPLACCCLDWGAYTVHHYVSARGPPRSYILCTTAFWSMKKLSLAFYTHSRPLKHMHSIFMSAQLRRLLLLIQQIAKGEQHRGASLTHDPSSLLR